MIATNKAEFERAYWAAQKPEVSALKDIQDARVREERSVELAVKGFVIDVEIMTLLWDAYNVMLWRQNCGFTWYPSMLQPPIQIVPNSDAPNFGTRYDPKNPPPGSIKVSLDLDDYPPFLKPPAVVKPAFNPVGAPKGYAEMYEWMGGNEPDGYEFTDARGRFVKHIREQAPTPFGRQFVAWFTKVA